MGIVVKKKSTEIYGVDTSYFNENNKEFVVSNSIELEAGQTYDIGEGSVLIFDKDGGFTTDEENPATIVLNNTQIIAPMKQIFDTNVKIVGLMKNTEVYPEWFGAKGDGVTDDADAINAALYNAGHVRAHNRITPQLAFGSRTPTQDFRRATKKHTANSRSR